MMRSSVQYRRLNVQDKSENENDISTSDGETTKDNIPNDDFVDYVGADGIRFVPNNTKKKKKLGQWVPEQVLHVDIRHSGYFYLEEFYCVSFIKSLLLQGCSLA